MLMNQQNQSLFSFLTKKTLFNSKIDYDVISSSWSILQKHISLPFVIHIIGTNGKGSTGRFLSHLLSNNGYRTLHYSSPHILRFNERIWCDGQDSTDTQLNYAHNKLHTILPSNLLEKLTYFEYTTLLAFVLSEEKDYLVLEAGLGGEFDATNVVENDLTLITTIGLDHIEFLGDTIEKIATTKMKSCDKQFILGHQVFTVEVENVKLKVLKDKKEIPLSQNISLLKDTNKLPKYLQNNLKLVVTTLDYLNLKIVNASLPTLFGRCQKLNSNITIDVGHNSLAATVLLREFAQQKIILIYNSYKDKNYKEVLQILRPIISELQIISIDDDRIVDSNSIIDICDALNITVKKYHKIDINQKYLVFGSFKVVEIFLKSWTR